MVAKLRPVPSTPQRAVLYLRQSMAKDDSVSMDLQEIAGRDYCARQGYEVTAIERDEGISGRTWVKRPAVQRVMEMIEARDADIIVLWKWSRLSRNRAHWALAADRVDVAGGRIESATEPIDTATASGRFARGVMTEYAAFQSEQIGEQWVENMDRRFGLGLPPTGIVPWGWASRKTFIEPVPGQAEHIPHLYQMYLEGRGWTAIAAHMNRTGIEPPRRARNWLTTTVKRILDSPIHAGMVTYRGEVREGAHEGLINRDTWTRYRRAREARTTPARPGKSSLLLATLIRCHCGHKRYGKASRSGERWVISYCCPSAVEHPPRTKSIPQWKVDAAVAAWVKSLPIEAATSMPRPDNADAVEAIAREITAVERKLVRLTEHLLEEIVSRPVYDQTREKLEREKQRLLRDLEIADRDRHVSPAMYLAGLNGVADRWDTLPISDKQAVLRSIVAEVVVLVSNQLEIRAAWGERVTIET